MPKAVKETDILTLNKPKANQPIEYYRKFLQHLDPLVSLWEIRLGFIRWLQGVALNEAVDSRKVKHGEYGRLLVLLGTSKSTAFNCRSIARQVPLENARKYGYSEMLRLCGLLNDQSQDFGFVDDDDDDDVFDLGLAEDDDYDEGEQPLPNITYHNFLPKLEAVRDTLEAISTMDYGVQAPEESLKRYLEAQKHLAKIKRFCGKVEKMLTTRIGTNRKARRTRNSA